MTCTPFRDMRLLEYTVVWSFPERKALHAEDVFGNTNMAKEVRES